MGVLRIKIAQLSRLEAPLHSHCKAKSKLYIRAFVHNQPHQQGPAAATTLGTTTLVERATIEEPLDRAAKLSSTRFTIQEINKFPCVTAPLMSEVPELVLEGVRFSSVVVVDLMQENRMRPLCRSLLSMQHGVLGVARQLSLSLYPVREEVSDELPAACALASMRLVVTPTDFCPEAATVDHVTRAEEDGPRMERLRLFFAAYTPERLPWLDVVAAMAREAGWDATFRELLVANGGVEPVLQHLKVTIKQGLNMPAEGSSYVDPYVQIAILKPPPPVSASGAAKIRYHDCNTNRAIGGLGEVLQTTVHKNLRNPVFNESFDVTLFRGDKDCVWLRVWDYDSTSADDYLGEVVFPLGLLLRGVPTTRTLPVMDSYRTICSLEVEFTAIDFGLEPAVYQSIVDSVLQVDKPRLEAYYKQYDGSQLRHVEQKLIEHALEPNGFETFMETLIAKYGLEPGKQFLTVTIHSVQNILHPKRRTKVDLSKTFVNDDPKDYQKTSDGFRITVNYWGTVHGTSSNTESISPTRVSYVGNTCSHQVSVRRPESDTVRVMVTLNRKHDKEKHDSICDVEAGYVEIATSSLVKNVARTRTFPLVCTASSPYWLNGSVTLSLTTTTFGHDTTPLYQLDEELDTVHRRRLGGMLGRYMNFELPKLDTILLEHENNIQSYIDGLVQTHGPEPGTYRVVCNVQKCIGLPRVEITGKGIDAYVTLTAGEETYTTDIVSDRSPQFTQGTFEVDIRNPLTDVIKVTVMDYDRNSDDDFVSITHIPVKSITGAMETRVLPLFAHDDRHQNVRLKLAEMVEGTMVVQLRAIGFGAQQPLIPTSTADEYRKRIVKMYQRYDVMQAIQSETQLWSWIDTSTTSSDILPKQPAFLQTVTWDPSSTNSSPEGAIHSLVQRYGAEPGTGKVSVTVHRIEGLLTDEPKRNTQGGTRFLPVDAASAATAMADSKLSVSIRHLKTCPITKSRSECDRDDSGSPLKSPRPTSSNGGEIQFTAIVDLERPLTDNIRIKVQQSNTLTTKEFGVITIATAPLACGGNRRANLRVPVVHEPTLHVSEPYISGWAVVSISTTGEFAPSTKTTTKTADHLPSLVKLDDAIVIAERDTFMTQLTNLIDRRRPTDLEMVDIEAAAVEQRLLEANSPPAPPHVQAAYATALTKAKERYGALPGTYQVSIEVIGFKNMESSNSAYYVQAVHQLGGREVFCVGAQVKDSSSSALVMILDLPRYPTTANDIVFSIKSSESSNKIIYTADVPIHAISNDAVSADDVRWVPLGGYGKLPEYHKNLSPASTIGSAGGATAAARTSKYQIPMIGLRMRSVGMGSDLGSKALSDISRQLDDLRVYLFRMLHRHSPGLLTTVETCVWAGLPRDARQLATFDTASHQKTIRDQYAHSFGRGEGQGLVSVTIHSIEKLVKSRGKVAKTARPYVEILCAPGPDRSFPLNAVTRTATQKATPGPNHMSLTGETTFTFDLADPDQSTSFLELVVMDDVVGADYEFGRVLINYGFGLVQSGVPRKRLLPIIHKPNTNEASVSGYLSVTIWAQSVARTTPIDEEVESPLLKRCFAMYRRYLRSEMHMSDYRVHSSERAKHLDDLVLRFGPEPGTFRVAVTIHSCSNLPRVEMLGAGCDPYVEIDCDGDDPVHTRILKNNLNPSFEESFEMDMCNPTQGEIRLTLFDYDGAGDDDEVGSVYIPMSSVFAFPTKRELPLALTYETFEQIKCKRQGSITVSVRSIGFGVSEAPVAPELELDIRQRIVAVYDFYQRPLPSTYEVEMWSAAVQQQPGKPMTTTIEDALRRVVAACGPEPGSRTLQVTIESMHDLRDGSMKLVNDATPYIVATAQTALGGDTTITTKTSTTKGASQPEYRQSFTLELADPSSNVITLQVMNDVTGRDYEFGKAYLTAKLLQKGVAKRRTIPIYKIKDGGKEGQQRGTLTVTILSTRFGCTETWDEESELSFTKRLQQVYLRHAPGLLPEIATRVGMHLSRWQRFLAEEVQRLGPEPGRYTLTLTLTPPADAPSGHTYRIAGESSATTCEVVPSKPHTYALDLVSATEVLTIDEVDKSNVVVRQSRFPIGWLVPGDAMANTTQTRQVTVVPNYALRKDKDTSPIVLSSMTVSIVSTTCGASRVNGVERGGPDRVAIEDSYRQRMQQLLLRSYPRDVILVDDFVLGRSDKELDDQMQNLIAAYGTEAGQTTIAVAIRSLDELPAGEGPSVYVKLYLNGKPIGKRLLAEIASSATTAFLPPSDVIKVDDDILSIKVGVAGMLKSRVIGRAAVPVKMIPLGERSQQDGGVGNSVFDVTAWVFSEETRVYVGRVTLSVQIKGFPTMNATDAQLLRYFDNGRNQQGPSSSSRPRASCLTTLLSKELVAVAWARSKVTSTPPSLTEHVFSIKKHQASMVTNITTNASTIQALTNAGIETSAIPSKTAPISLVEAARWQSKFAMQKSYRTLMSTEAAIVLLHVVACRGVPQMDRFGTCDTFVEAQTCYHSSIQVVGQRSNVVSGTLNPTFRFQRDDVFAVEYTNVMDQAAIALASVVPVEAVQSGAVRAVPLPMGGVVHPYLASAANRPSLTLVVKDKDMASEELIGYVDVSPALLAAGFYDVDAQKLAALPAGSPAAADAWIAAHEARLLRLPIVLPGEDGAPPQHRGEILLCTTAPCLESARGTYLTPYSVYVAEGAGHVARALTTATRCLLKHKCWRELQGLHSYVAEQVLCHDVYRDRPTASIKERCDRLVEALTVEYGAA